MPLRQDGLKSISLFGKLYLVSFHSQKSVSNHSV
jgi:hypothetical protein